MSGIAKAATHRFLRLQLQVVGHTLDLLQADVGLRHDLQKEGFSNIATCIWRNGIESNEPTAHLMQTSLRGPPGCPEGCSARGESLRESAHAMRGIGYGLLSIGLSCSLDVQ